jgi:oligopeptide/dipeptide ABC transporter ATP-binding protein
MNDPLLKVSRLTKQFKFGRVIVPILKEVSFSLSKGETLGLGGESGCGKSTLGKAILRLIEPTSGSILFNGRELLAMGNTELQRQRRHMQMVFQNPSTSFNPRFTVEEILSEPLIIHNLAKGDDRKARLHDSLSQVGLDTHFLTRVQHELSGGEKQRIAIARALTLHPSLIVCDEPFSALDGSIQLQIMNLLKDLQTKFQMAYLLISHDLSALRYFSHRLAIMYMGQFVELGPTDKVYNYPKHPYTQALISSVPLPDPRLERNRKPVILRGELPSLLVQPKGCPFYSRCQHASAICKKEVPKWTEVASGHFTACHLH